MKLSDPLTLIEWPVGRRSHSSCCFATGEQSSSYLLVLGGEDEDNDHVNDCWLLRIKDWTWKQVMFTTVQCKIFEGYKFRGFCEFLLKLIIFFCKKASNVA